MQDDWKALIVKIVNWKQLANENDKLSALPWNLPNLAANEAQVAEAETSMGRSFSAPYREFLRLANGWKGFIVSTDLFGTDDFLNGRALEVLERQDVRRYISSLGLPEEAVIPIGASDADADVFILVSESHSTNAGQMLWLAGSEVERFPSFRDFLEAMVNYNAQLAQTLATEQ